MVYLLFSLLASPSPPYPLVLTNYRTRPCPGSLVSLTLVICHWFSLIHLQSSFFNCLCLCLTWHMQINSSGYYNACSNHVQKTKIRYFFSLFKTTMFLSCAFVAAYSKFGTCVGEIKIFLFCCLMYTRLLQHYTRTLQHQTRTFHHQKDITKLDKNITTTDENIKNIRQEQYSTTCNQYVMPSDKNITPTVTNITTSNESIKISDRNITITVQYISLSVENITTLLKIHCYCRSEKNSTRCIL